MRALRTATLCIAMFAFAGLAACSSDDSTDVDADDAASGPTTPDDRESADEGAGIDRPDGPQPEVTGPLTGGDGVLLLASTPVVLPESWVEEEFRVAGTATSYQADGELPADGHFELTERDTAEYATRVVVRRPADPADFNGTVVVEWFNVSGGADAAPDFTYVKDEVIRGGYAWIGVSAQQIGVEGGPVLVGNDLTRAAGAGQGIKAMDPERYEDLDHPGDAYAYDIFTQVARAVRDEAGPVLGDLQAEVDQVLAIGESQSGYALTTYINGFQPQALQFDGFLVHSRGGASAPLGEPGEGIALADAIGQPPVTIRTDGPAPVLIVQAEGDMLGILGYHAARQDDTDTLRLWEIAGSAHADAYQIGEAASALECGAPVNNGPQHFVLKAGLRHLSTWAAGGDAPPSGEPLNITDDDTPAVVRDDLGIAEGGVRTPVVDVPVEVLSGEPAEGADIMCILFGTTQPIPADVLAQRYESADAYLDDYAEAARAAIDAGFVLEDDLDELLDWAQPELLEA